VSARQAISFLLSASMYLSDGVWMIADGTVSIWDAWWRSVVGVRTDNSLDLIMIRYRGGCLLGPFEYLPVD